jgi:hypothetical protein
MPRAYNMGLAMVCSTPTFIKRHTSLELNELWRLLYLSLSYLPHLAPAMSLARTIRSMRRVGLKQWWRDLQYIGDAKSGTLVGKDQ